MNRKSLGLTVGAGIATVLIVGVAVTELVSSQIEFSLFVGIPAGLLAGAIAAGLVARGLGDDAPAERRRYARAFGAFGLVFLAVLIVSSVASLGTLLAILAGVVGGGLAGIGMYVREVRTPESGATA